MLEFSGLNLATPILRAVQDLGYTTPTPIQAKAIPPLLQGRDLVGIAQTGTGKTAAFLLPLLQHLSDGGTRTRGATRALVLVPTRELATQIGDSFRAYGRHLGLRHAVVFGGVPIGAQIRAVSQGLDALFATPGRLLDLMAQKYLRLDRVEVFVLDEADRMLDMGFVRDVRKVVAALPLRRQTAMFSATMPASVGELAQSLLHDPARVEVAPQATTVERVAQHVIFVEHTQKRDLLRRLLNDHRLERVLIFTRTKRGADRVAEHLGKCGIGADAIHGNKAQNARQRALEAFRTGGIRALVATDIAARGIDVDGVTHVINFDLPNEPESYVHRIGRTARAGAEGVAISFCDGDERAYLRDIEKTIRERIPVIGGDPGRGAAGQATAKAQQPKAKQQPQRSGRAGAPRRHRPVSEAARAA